MNFLDTIGNLLDLSKKQQNFPKDIENLQKILETIQEGLRQVDQNDLPLHIADLLNSHLKATEELLQNLSQRHHSWWAVVQKLVPGTDIWKLKVNYDEFLHIDKVLNLYLTKGKKSKRSALSCLPLASEVMYGSVSTKRLRTVSDRGIDVNLLDVPLRKSATSLNLNSSYRHSFPPSRMNSLNRTTSTTLGLSSIKEEPENKGKLAFKLKLLYEDKLDGFIRQYRIVPKVIEEYWNGGDHKEFIFRREEFNYLPIKESTKLSRDHAALIVTRQSKKKIIKGDTESSNVMIEEEPNKSTTSSQEDDEYEYKFVLRDLSLNGTYYLKGAQPEDNNVHAAKVIGEFAPLTKNTEVELTHGDIVGLIMQKPACNELTFGFQLFTH